MPYFKRKDKNNGELIFYVIVLFLFLPDYVWRNSWTELWCRYCYRWFFFEEGIVQRRRCRHTSHTSPTPRWMWFWILGSFFQREFCHALHCVSERASDLLFVAAILLKMSFVSVTEPYAFCWIPRSKNKFMILFAKILSRQQVRLEDFVQIYFFSI